MITNTKYKIKTAKGKDGFKGIQRLKKSIYEISFKHTDKTLKATAEHRFYIDKEATVLKEVSELKANDWLYNEEFGYLCIDNIKEQGETEVYDIVGVDNDNLNFIASGFVSHNCEFQGASNTLIPGELLLQMYDDIQQPIDIRYNGKFRIYEQPEDRCQYLLGVDPAEGLGKDYSVIQVFKLNGDDDEYLLEQVAVFQDNTIPIKEFSQTIVAIGRYYKDAYAMIENNNACGGLTCHRVWYEYEYENMIHTNKKNGKLGINTNVKTKYAMNMKLMELCNTYKIKFVDEQTIVELNSYEQIRPNIFAAGNASIHDDTVTAILHALQYFDTKWYENYKSNYGSEISEEYVLHPPAFRAP